MRADRVETSRHMDVSGPKVANVIGKLANTCSKTNMVRLRAGLCQEEFAPHQVLVAVCTGMVDVSDLPFG